MFQIAAKQKLIYCDLYCESGNYIFFTFVSIATVPISLATSYIKSPVDHGH